MFNADPYPLILYTSSQVPVSSRRYLIRIRNTWKNLSVLENFPKLSRFLFVETKNPKNAHPDPLALGADPAPDPSLIKQ